MTGVLLCARSDTQIASRAARVTLSRYLTSSRAKTQTSRKLRSTACPFSAQKRRSALRGENLPPPGQGRVPGNSNFGYLSRVTEIPTTFSVLQSLTKERLVEVARIYNLSVSKDRTKDRQIQTLTDSGFLAFRQVLGHMSRDELRTACRVHGLPDTGRARMELAGRLIEAHGDNETQPLPHTFLGLEPSRYFPKKGDIVQVRHRQWLAEEVIPAPEHGEASLVSLVCLDDDNQGARTSVLWELELGAKVQKPEVHGLGNIHRLDPPRYFGAYLHALKWNAVTATDAKLFQAPFRAGIKLMAHQLTPLKKALELPRANLFIADDVGLGKTIEAGLVLQELLLRQQVELALIVCPASVTLQWKDEMQKRFGLHFELYNRDFVARRRRERGFGTNPWTTHRRFIISYQTLRRADYLEPLLQVLGDRADKSLLILDEAHTAAPASARKYAVDSRVTRVIRDLAPRFTNRLFLSATPHNGHSNSFSALLEILDPQRFTRGVPVENAKQLETVMVRRLKSDLRALGVDQFPKRRVVQIDLKSAEPFPELELADKLARYTQLMKPDKGVGRLVFTNLQKRLLSSVEAFSRTLAVHANSVGEGRAKTALQLDFSTLEPGLEREDDDYGDDEESRSDEELARAEVVSRLLHSPEGQAKELLVEMQRLADRSRVLPDAKARALVDWVCEHQCPAAKLGGPDPSQKSEWSSRRVIIFTEYGDTKLYLQRILGAAIDGTDGFEERIATFHGGMSDAQRAELQDAWNGDPAEYPVRILIATDAAREGVNLQGHCADLFHYDIPWNPGRMEQRNGRIDRTLQPASEVRCYYFFYPDRKEDLVLQKLIKKVDVIHDELGSLGTVVLSNMEAVLSEERGIDGASAADLDRVAALEGHLDVVRSELETQRGDSKRLALEIEEAGRILNASQQILDFDPALLRDAIDVALELSGADRRLTPLAKNSPGSPDAFVLPELPESWARTLDNLRPPRKRDEDFWDWRKRAPEPVVFKAPDTIQSGRVHLHLEHPFVKRVLDRFRAQGYSAHDLSRVTVVKNPNDALVRVIAFGRLSLFGPGATRLHDKLVSVAAQWLESGGPMHLKPFAEAADKKAIDTLEALLTASPTLDGVSPTVQKRLLQSSTADFQALWPHIQDEADALAHEATQKLAVRAQVEADGLRSILEGQRKAINDTLKRNQQIPLALGEGPKDEVEQFGNDKKHMQRRLAAIDGELLREPEAIKALYQVAVQRLEPVGLIYLWPETRG